MQCYAMVIDLVFGSSTKI